MSQGLRTAPHSTHTRQLHPVHHITLGGCYLYSQHPQAVSKVNFAQVNPESPSSHPAAASCFPMLGPSRPSQLQLQRQRRAPRHPPSRPYSHVVGKDQELVVLAAVEHEVLDIVSDCLALDLGGVVIQLHDHGALLLLQAWHIAEDTRVQVVDVLSGLCNSLSHGEAAAPQQGCETAQHPCSVHPARPVLGPLLLLQVCCGQLQNPGV